MEPTTLRLSATLKEELDEEAEAAGFSSRSEYIRYLLANRDRVHADETHDTGPTTSDTAIPDEIRAEITSLTDRLDALET